MRALRAFLSAFTLIELLVVIAIVAVLAGLLLPALAAAREKARRTACISNLTQMARGLESYASDYSQYLPCWGPWGGSPNGYSVRTYLTKATTSYMNGAVGTWDDGWFTDGRGGRIRTNSTGHYSSGGTRYNYSMVWGATSRNRTVFYGDTAEGPPAGYDYAFYHTALGTVRPDPVAGRLNMGPHGLGYLVSCGYAGDARMFFCPSTGGSMPPTNTPGGGLGWNDWYNPYAATSPADLQRAGGFDAKSIMYGDWTWLKVYNGYGDEGRAVLSDYAYRNGPITFPIKARFAENPEPSNNARDLYDVLIGGTKPAVRASLSCPAFKTQKLLGGRAIVADSFGRSDYGRKEAAVLALEPPVGDGFYAHRDGYNVLYGDWSVKWYGDPQQRFIWWERLYESIYSTPLRATHTLMAGTQGTGLTWWYRGDGSDWVWSGVHMNTHVWNKGGTYAWHLLDVNAGIDVDTKP